MTVPSSFQQNTLDRMLTFLKESNAIEGITQIDYWQPAYQIADQGHFGALILSQQLAVNREPLAVRHIIRWQSLLVKEQIAFGHHIEKEEIGHIRGPNLQKNVRVGRHIPPDFSHVPTLLSHLIETINEELKDQTKLQDDAEYCRFLGRSFQQFEAIHPFADGNGRTGRLLANYIATFCKRPIIVFNSELSEKNRYYDAHISEEEMSRWMAHKVQEAIFSLNGTLLPRTKALSGLSSRYCSNDGQENEIFEWHSMKDLLINNKKEALNAIETTEITSSAHATDSNERKLNG